MTNQILTTWLTQSDAARRLGVSREAIRQAIAARRIEWNGKTGRDCRVRGDLLPARTLPPLTRAPKDPAIRTGKSPDASTLTRAPKTPAKTPDFPPGETGSPRAPKGSARRSGSSSEIVATHCTPKGPADKKTSPAPAATVPASAPKGSITPKGSIAPKSPRTSKMPAQNTPADQLIDARLRKLESDIALQTMRLESHKQEIYNQALSDFQTAYESAFTPLKKFLLSLDLPAETLRKLAAIADQCDADFQSEITP